MSWKIPRIIFLSVGGGEGGSGRRIRELLSAEDSAAMVRILVVVLVVVDER